MVDYLAATLDEHVECLKESVSVCLLDLLSVELKDERMVEVRADSKVC